MWHIEYFNTFYKIEKIEKCNSPLNYFILMNINISNDKNVIKCNILNIKNIIILATLFNQK